MEEALIEATINSMDKVIQNYEEEISKMRTGRANPNILDKIRIDSYGDFQPLKSVATIKVVEATQLLIKPYDPSSTKAIAEALNKANLQGQISVEKLTIRLTFSKPTEELRKSLVKELVKVTEKYHAKIRECRHKAMKELEIQNLPEDDSKKVKQEIQKITDQKTDELKVVKARKENELTTI